MLFLLCLVVALTAARAQESDPSTVDMPTPTFQDSDGDACQCVPYYLCDANLNAVYLDDPTLTGFGKLDIRFGEHDSCQESVERCCKVTKIDRNVSLPVPNSSRLKGCGYRNPKGLDFSISAKNNESQFGEFPWVVALMDPANMTYYGVGVLIHPQVVMTGAHIVSTFRPGKLKIRAGEWDTQTTKERLQSQEKLVDDFRLQEDFNAKNLYNDLALLRLLSPVELADHINVICLPSQDESFDNYKDCVANGWGKDLFGSNGQYSVILKRVELNMVSNPTCNNMLQKTRLGKWFQLHESFVCAGGEGKDTCQGDGGAPLACPIGNDQYKLSGLVAWGIGCGQEGVPAVYARVSSFRKWVDSVMAEWGYDTSGYTVR